MNFISSLNSDGFGTVIAGTRLEAQQPVPTTYSVSQLLIDFPGRGLHSLKLKEAVKARVAIFAAWMVQICCCVVIRSS